MAKPWKTLDSITTKEGVIELRQRDERDFLITLDNLVLMNSMANRSEVVLGQIGCKHLQDHPAPRVLIGGLGMGCTLKAALETLPATAQVVVAELNPVILDWCRGPLAGLTDDATSDPRVSIEVTDVAKLVKRTAKGPPADRFDAIIFDLYKGPHFRTNPQNDPLYGSRAIGYAHTALNPDGVFSIWGENFDEGFANRLKDGGFQVRNERPGRGGLRHVVFVAKRLDADTKQTPGATSQQHRQER